MSHFTFEIKLQNLLYASIVTLRILGPSAGGSNRKTLDSLDFKTCVEMIQERIERQASNLMISINNSFGQSEEAIFKNQKGSKKTDYPSSLSSQLYFTADALTEPLNIANTVSPNIYSFSAT